MLQEKIAPHAGQPLTLTVERGGQRFDVRLTPAVHEETNPIETVKQGASASRPRRASPKSRSRAGHAGGARRPEDVRLWWSRWPASGAELRGAGEPPGFAAGPVPIEVLRRLEVPAPGGALWAQQPVQLTLDAAAPHPASSAPT